MNIELQGSFGLWDLLRTWDRVGNLEREAVSYRHLQEHGLQVSFVTSETRTACPASASCAVAGGFRLGAMHTTGTSSDSFLGSSEKTPHRVLRVLC